MAAVFSQESLPALLLIKKDPISLFSTPEYSIIVIEISKNVHFSSQHCRSDVEMLTLSPDKCAQRTLEKKGSRSMILHSTAFILCLLDSKPSPHLMSKGFRGSVSFYWF